MGDPIGDKVRERISRLENKLGERAERFGSDPETQLSALRARKKESIP